MTLQDAGFSKKDKGKPIEDKSRMALRHGIILHKIDYYFTKIVRNCV
jgi:hypothetical protein